MRRFACLMLAAGLACAANGARAAPARQFLADAIRGDNSEMILGRIAADRGDSAGVRDYGARLHGDHANAGAEAAAVARALRIPVPGGMTPEAARERARLQRLRGPAFDREFVRYMANDHREDIAKFERQARTGDRRTAALAQAQLPTLREHLRIAESLRR
jgi:putative membrane protein